MTDLTKEMKMEDVKAKLKAQASVMLVAQLDTIKKLEEQLMELKDQDHEIGLRTADIEAQLREARDKFSGMEDVVGQVLLD